MQEIIIQRAVLADKQICDIVFRIRQAVFVTEQQVSREEEFDQWESSSLHYLGSINGTGAGTARWRFTDKGIKLERFAVLPEFRKMGVAAALLHQVVGDTRFYGIKTYLHAQVSAVGFYEKYGFNKAGPMFSEANIDHYMMTYEP
jgi:predicted GNAT family N-acyltransferase